MKILGFIKQYGFHLFCLVLFGSFLALSANAQQLTKTPVLTMPTNPQFDYLISWRAVNYVPADYQGKILPAKNSTIEASFDVLDNGKFVDISKQNIVWYLNNNLLKSGVGLKTVRFSAAQNTDQVLDITIPNYQDAKYKIADVGTLITVPISSPQIVINAPYPGKAIRIGDNLFQALPYFFNITNPNQLKISWDVDGAQTAGQQGNADILNLTSATQGSAAEGANVGIKVTAQDQADIFSFAQHYINLDIK